MFPKLLSTAIIGISSVPTLLLSRFSRSRSRCALRLKTLSASLPATITPCSSLCTLSASWSTWNSSEDCIFRSRSSVFDLIALKEAVSSARNPLIFPSSESRRSKSGSTIWSAVSSSANKGGSLAGGFLIPSHAAFSSFNLGEGQTRRS